MKRFTLKQITALVLALVMTLSLLPTAVWAEDVAEDGIKTKEYTVTNETDASLPFTASYVYDNYENGVWNAVDDGPTAGSAISSHVASVGFNIDYFVIETVAAGTLSIAPIGSTEEVTFKLVQLVNSAWVEVPATGEYTWEVDADGFYILGALTGYNEITGESTAEYLPSITATFSTVGNDNVVEYKPLYWSDDGGATYHNGIEIPFAQPISNRGRMATLYVKSGENYVAIDKENFGNETMTKLNGDIGFFGWGVNGDGDERVFWNTENTVEGTESGIVFNVDGVRYLIKLRIMTFEESCAPLYWSNDNGKTYYNGIVTPLAQRANNHGYLFKLYIKDGDTYTAIDNESFGEDTIAKSSDIGVFVWSGNRLNWNTGDVAEGTEGNVVFTVDEVQYLIKLCVMSAEEGAADFVSQYAKDLNGDIIDISSSENIAIGLANRIFNSVFSWERLTDMQRSAVDALLQDESGDDSLTFEKMLTAAAQRIYATPEAFVTERLSSDGVPYSTITAKNIWNIQNIATYYKYLPSSVKEGVDVAVDVNFASIKAAGTTLTGSDIAAAADFILKYMYSDEGNSSTSELITSLDSNSTTAAINKINNGKTAWNELTPVQQTAVNKSLKNADPNAQTYEDMLSFVIAPEYVPLYWSDLGGNIYYNGIVTPFTQRANNHGGSARLYTKEGGTYTAIDKEAFRNAAMTKPSNLGYIELDVESGWLFWNTGKLSEGTEGSVVLDINGVKYLINLRVMSAEEGAADFVERYAKDLNGEIIDISAPANMEIGLANRIFNSVFNWERLTNTQRSAVNALLQDESGDDSLTFEAMLTAAAQRCFPTAEAFVADRLSSDGVPYTTIATNNLWDIWNIETYYEYLSSSVKEGVDAAVNVNFASIKTAGTTLTGSDIAAAASFIITYLYTGESNSDSGELITFLDSSSTTETVNIVRNGETAWGKLTPVQQTAVNKSLKNADPKAQTYEQMIAFTQPEARWFPAGTSGWEGRGTLLDAVAYANSLASGTAYIQLLSDVDTTAPLEFARDKTTILDLNGFDIDRGLTEATTNGNVITVYGNLTLCDSSANAATAPGKITGGYTNGSGGGVRLYPNSFLIMSDGEISGNKASGYSGGGVYVDSNSSFTLNGGVIAENTATSQLYGHGGGVCANGTFTMNGGTIYRNTSFHYSGGVEVDYYGSFTMNGGTISGNKAARYGGGVYVTSSGVFTMNGGCITGNTSSYNGSGVYSDRGTINVSGAPIILGNVKNGTWNETTGFYEAGDGESINNIYLYDGVDNKSDFAVVGALSNGAFIGIANTLSDNTSLVVATGSGNPVYTLTESDAAKFVSDNGYVAELDSANNAVLMVKLTEAATASLYGPSIVSAGSEVTLTFSLSELDSTSAEMTLNYDSSVLEYVSYRALLNDWTVVKDGTKFTLTSYRPIFTETDLLSVTFRVKEDASADASLSAYFRNIVVSDGSTKKDIGTAFWRGTVNSATEARWGLATGTNGDQVPTEWVGSGPLTAAVAYANGLASGTAYIQLLSDVDTTAPLVFASGKTTILDLNGKTVDRGLTKATPNGNVITANGNLTLCDTSSEDVTKHGKITGGNNSNDGGGVYVAVNGVSIYSRGYFTMNGGIICGNTAHYGGGVAGDIIMNGGTISSNSATVGGGVYGYFTMNGGLITENTATDIGGGVAVFESKMTGGTISRNTTTNMGGGVLLYSGTFTMDGGLITDNTVAYLGGGVYLNDGNFIMNGGTISQNKATGGSDGGGSGGGVNVTCGSFTMNGGFIEGNSAEYSGGGINISRLDNRDSVLRGGTISGNTAKEKGGGVYSRDDDIQVFGTPVISGNVLNGTLNSTTGLYELGTNGAISNVDLGGGTITVIARLKDGASIGVSTKTNSTSVVVAQGGGDPVYTITESDAAKFASDNGYVAELDSTNNSVLMVKPEPPIVGLGTTSGSLNLFQETALTVPVECNYDFVGARFEKPGVDALFDISVGENGTLQITPKDKPEDMTWAEWGKEMTGSHTSAIEIEYIRGQYVTSETLTIKLTATAPTVKATAVKFNSFIAGNTQPLVLTTTNGVITNVTVDESKATDKAPACPTWITLNDDLTATLVNEELVNKKGSGKLNLEVWLEGWRAPAQVAVSVSAAYTAPKLKLSASSVNLMSSSRYQEPVALTLLSGDKTAFEAIGVTNLRVTDLAELSEKDQKTYAASAYAYVAEYSEETGAFTLMTDGKPINGKVLLFATIDGAAAEVSIPLTVKVVMPALKATPTKVTLNTAKGYGEGERDEMTVAFSGAIPDFWYNDVTWEITPPKNAAADMITVENNGDGTVTFYANEGIVDGSYKVNVTVGAAKPVAITVTAKATLPKLKLDKSSITLNTAMGDYADVQSVTVTDSDANYDFVLKQDEVKAPAALSAVVGENNVISVSTAATTAPGSYKVEIDHKMPGGQSVKSALTVKVVNKLPTVKLGSSSVSLHNEVGIAEIPVSGIIGYENCSLVPVVSDFVSVTGDSEKLTVTLTENAEVGKTYKVNVEYNVGNEKTKAVALSVKVVNAITATASIKGNMDVTRPGNTSSNFTFKYTGWYPGEYNDAAYEPTLVWEVYAMNGKNKIADYEEYDFVNGKGSLVASSDDNNGGWFCDIDDADYGVVLALNTDEVGAWKNGEVNPKYAYTVEAKLVFDDGTEIASKPVKMTVKQGSVKFAADVKAVDIFKQAEAESEPFSIKKTDKDADNVADNAKVAVAASKTPSAFEVIETGDGYAIKVVNPTIAKSGTVKLNIWLEGNYEEGCEEIWDTKSPEYRKPNATVSLKVNLKEAPPEPEKPEEEKPTQIVTPLSVSRAYPKMTAVGDVEPYGNYYASMENTVGEDLSDAPALAYSLNISNKTQFSGMPEGYDQTALIEWGKDPGLNVDILHEYGFTGEGATIAYIDQPLTDHEQYADINLHYTNNADSDDSMHGPMVLSLLAGKDTGTAPDAKVYFYGHASWKADQTTHAECLYQIIEQNKSLPEGEKITMVGFSDNIDPQEKNADALREAVAACEAAGVMVFFCGDYSGGAFLPMSDKTSPENVVSLGFGDGVVVPTSGRTGAGSSGYSDYYYWGRGGLSWAMPYVLGLYAIVTEIDPSLTKTELLSLLSETATEANGMRVVNPVGFVSAVLQRVGRVEEALALETAVTDRQKYLYAVMDTASLSESDLDAISGYLASFDGVQVIVVDTASVTDAKSLYTLLKKDAAARGGTIVGVQLFGTPDDVPTFTVGYRVQMASGVDEGGTFLSDLFYGNFENDASRIFSGYNVLDHFAEEWDVDLIPQWAVARLPLQKGEFSAFFEKYTSFAQQTDLKQQRLVNFSNPIFRQSVHSDSFGRFLQRMDGEGLVTVPYTLYGNLDGSYPVDTQVEGNFTPENLAIENAKGSMELVINSHGQWNNIDQCTFNGNEEQRKSLVNMDTINTVLSDSPYYLDCWTCLNGFGMKNNLTTTALSGQCVGMFSATAIISNNGVNCDASLSEMAKSNFYYFYYHYLKALRDGVSRSQSFLTAQREYGNALLADRLNGIRGEGNYQFNLCNLLAYHNFGVLEPSVDMMTLSQNSGVISQSPEKPDGNPVGEEIILSFDTEIRGDMDWTITGYTAQKLDNGRVRFVLTHTAGKTMPFAVFDPPNGEKFMYNGTSNATTITYELSEKDILATEVITLSIDQAPFFVFFNTSQLR